MAGSSKPKAHQGYKLQQQESALGRSMHRSILKRLLAAQIFVICLAIGLAFWAMHPLEEAFFWYVLEHFFTPFLDEQLPLSAVLDLRYIPPIKWALRAICASFALYLLWPWQILRYQRKSRERFHQRLVRGSQLVTLKKLKAQLPKEPPLFDIADCLSLPFSYQTRHISVAGTTGSGKTASVLYMLSSIRRWPVGKAIVFDNTGGELIAKCFNPATDMIVGNPFEQRCRHWNFFEIFEDPESLVTDFDSVTASAIPHKETGDNYFFFVDTARQILTAVIKFAYLTGNPSLDFLRRFFASSEVYDMLLFVLSKIDPKVMSFIKNQQSPQTQGVESVLNQHITVFNYMFQLEAQETFSIKEWILSDKPGFIFLPIRENQRDALRGIISLFLDAFLIELLSLPNDLNRRIPIVLDEFGELYPIRAIAKSFKLIRKKGGVLVLGVQEKAQLDLLYGPELADSILNNCNTRIIFRLNESNTAEYFSRLLDDAEIEVTEATSSSDTDNDNTGASFRRRNEVRRTVLSSEIKALGDLECYVQVLQHPITRLKLRYPDMPDMAEPFIPQPFFLSSNLAATLPGANGALSLAEVKNVLKPTDALQKRKKLASGQSLNYYPIDRFDI